MAIQSLMVCLNHIYFSKYHVVFFISIFFEVWRQQRGGVGGFLNYWFRGGSKKSSKYAEVTLVENGMHFADIVLKKITNDA